MALTSSHTYQSPFTAFLLPLVFAVPGVVVVALAVVFNWGR